MPGLFSNPASPDYQMKMLQLQQLYNDQAARLQHAGALQQLQYQNSYQQGLQQRAMEPNIQQMQMGALQNQRVLQAEQAQQQMLQQAMAAQSNQAAADQYAANRAQLRQPAQVTRGGLGDQSTAILAQQQLQQRLFDTARSAEGRPPMQGMSSASQVPLDPGFLRQYYERLLAQFRSQPSPSDRHSTR